MIIITLCRENIDIDAYGVIFYYAYLLKLKGLKAIFLVLNLIILMKK